MRAGDHTEAQPPPHAVILNFDRTRRDRPPSGASNLQQDGSQSLPRPSRPPNAKLARACNQIIVAIIALPIVLAILSLLRRMFFH